MRISIRIKLLCLCATVALVAGCEKSSTTGGAGKAPVPAPGPSGDLATSAYAKKLVGKWEGTDDTSKDKNGKADTITVEFKGDGKMSIDMGPFLLAGTYKVTKEDGKTLTVETELSLEDLPPGKDGPKSNKKSFNVVFEGDDTITMTPDDKKDPKTLKRKK